MKTADLIGRLDKEFKIAECEEDLVEFAITLDNKQFINPHFINRQTGLLLKGSEDIKKVISVVFVTDEIIAKVCQEKDALIFTHHHFDYYENEKGLQAIRPEQIEQLIKANHSLYVAHAPLDTHIKYGTSIALAKICGISIEKFFFDYFGAPTALIGSIEKATFENFSSSVRKNLSRPLLTLHKHRDHVEKIGVVAGGGDIVEILLELDDNNCDTLLTGTIEHRWNVPFIQEGNRKFHDLNKKLKLNLVGGTHYGTERPAMVTITQLFEEIGIESEFMEDENLLLAK